MSRAAAKSRAEKGRATSVPAPPPPPSQSPDVVEIVPGRLTQASWVSMLGQEDGEEVVSEVLDDFLGHVMDKCYEVYLQKQLVPFTVSWARDALVHIVEWQFLDPDKGEGPEDAPSWSEDAEPLPSTTDSWAQGCVSVIQAKPPKQPSPRQKIPVGRAAKKTDQRANQRSQMMAISSTSPKHSRKETQLREPPGFRGYKLSSDPPLKKEGQTKGLSKSPLIKPTLDLQSSQYFLSSSVDEEEKGEKQGEGEERGTPSSSLGVQPLHQHEYFPVMPRVDPACLPRHRVWPQYDILDTGASKHQPRRTRAAPTIPGGQRHDRQHIIQTEALKPLVKYDAPSKPKRRSALSGAVVLSFKRKSILGGGSSGGIVPFSGTLMLDTMDLAPGVSVKGPQGTRSRQLKGGPDPPENSAELRPIQINVPVPVFPLEQLTAGATPRVTPLL